MCSASTANATAFSVLVSARPETSGTRPWMASLAARNTASFSGGDSWAFSPTMPIITTPPTPASMRRSSPARIASRSSVKSGFNLVVTAGKTPFHWMVLMLLGLSRNL